MASSTKDDDKKFQRILRELKVGDGAKVHVGFFADEEHPNSDDFTVAEIAAVNEFGSEDGRIPERPFIRSTVDNNNMFYRGLLHKLQWKVLEGGLSTIKALSLFGTHVASDMRKTITDLSDPPNAEATIEKKGVNNPLIDTGTMRAKVKHKVKV